MGPASEMVMVLLMVLEMENVRLRSTKTASIDAILIFLSFLL